jgi:PAS domain S-box-containing protein
MKTPGAEAASAIRSVVDPARVLLIVDNPAGLPGLESCLEVLEAGWVRVASLREAAGRLSASAFDLAIVAVDKSDLDVDELAQSLRKLPRGKHLPILFITGRGPEGEAVERAYALGAVDFLPRPIGVEALRAKVALFLEVSRSRRPMDGPAAGAFESPRSKEVPQELAERRAAEEAKYRLAAIVESSDDAIISKTLDGVVTSWNRTAERMFGYTAEEAIGKSITLIIPEERLPEEREILSRVLRGERLDHFETRRRRKDGSLIDISLTVSPVKETGGRIIGASKIARDITDQKKSREEIARMNAVLEERVRERTRSLQETVQELDSFAYTVAHDLRAPLRAVHTFGEMLLEETSPKLDDAEKRYLEEIIFAGARMDALIRDLLGYSRISREETRREPLDLGGMLENVIRELAPELSQRKAEIRIEGQLPQVMGHAVMLGQALTNLITNAAKFVAPGKEPRITVKAEKKAHRIRLWVLDNGIGIAPEHHAKLFRVFERLHAREAYPGTGIGLAIVRRAVERMGGTAGVESAPDAGSRFWIELEAAEEPGLRTEPTAALAVGRPVVPESRRSDEGRA